MRRDEALARLRAQVEAGRPIIGAGAGTGLSAKCAEAGGADLVIVYNSGRYRMAGRGSLAGLLPYGDANAIVVEMAGEVLPIVERTPVLAGVCGTDPFRRMPVFLRQLQELGFTGVQNFPTVGLFDGLFRANLEETGMGYELEVELVRSARELELLTAPYAFDADGARRMAAAGADVLVPHMGLTTAGTIGAKTAITLDEA
ncbi:MAG: phosphoenolpyruvate hydrolase family protein, partial [Thermoleophilia bacterium]|nr:phosphoenolpyruvate hydrolase family protein [Thermoleophilia bacterium]